MAMTVFEMYMIYALFLSLGGNAPAAFLVTLMGALVCLDLMRVAVSVASSSLRGAVISVVVMAAGTVKQIVVRSLLYVIEDPARVKGRESRKLRELWVRRHRLLGGRRRRRWGRNPMERAVARGLLEYDQVTKPVQNLPSVVDGSTSYRDALGAFVYGIMRYGRGCRVLLITKLPAIDYARGKNFFQKIVATIRNISSFSPATAWDTIGEWWKDCSDDKEFPGPTPGAPVVESSHENVTSPFVSESASNTTLCAGDDLPPLKQADASMECPSSPEGPVYQDPRNDNVLDKTTEMRDVDPAVEAEPAATVCLTVVPSDATLECDIKRNVADMDEIMTQIDFIVKSASKKKYRRNRPRGTVPSPQVSGHKRAERDSEHGVCPEKNAKKLRLTSGEDKYEKNTEKPSGASDIETEVEPPLSVITGKRSEQDWEDDDSFEARPAKRGRLSSPRSQTSADSSPHCPVPETHSQLPVSQSTEAGVAPLPDDDGTAKDDSAKSAVEKTLDELRDEALRLCQGFESVGRIFWSMLDNCQGYHNGTCNGCAVISFAVALRHLVSAHILKNCEIDAAIIDDSPVLLKKIRGETQSQLDPHDVKEELCQLGLWSDEQYLGSCGGNILGTDLSSFVQTFSENPGKVASTVLFHGHVISILKSFRDDGTAFYDIVDSMPHDNQPGKGGSRYRCMDSESVVALLSFYAFSKLSEEDLKTEYDAGKAYSGLEPRFFEAALWKPASTLDERTRQEGIDRLHAGIEQEKEDRILDGFRAEVARRDEALARQWQHCYNVSLCY